MQSKDIALLVLLGLSFYAYFGYPLILKLLRGVKKTKLSKGGITPRVSVLLVVRDEADRVGERVENLLGQDYPADLLDVTVASDGSGDETGEVIEKLAEKNPRVTAKVFDENRGKAPVFNDVVPELSGEIIFFADARQKWQADFVRNIVRHFADEKVGVVSGELRLDPEQESRHGGVGLYWRYEKVIRKMESDTGAVVGATGAGYAVRKELFSPLAENCLIEDVVLPLRVLASGRAVLFEENAVALDRLSEEAETEFRRKVRTLAGNYQVFFHPFSMGRWYKTGFRFLSHKFSRLMVPWMMLSTVPLCFISTNGWAVPVGVIETVFVGMGLLGLAFPDLKRKTRSLNFSTGFCLLNIAAIASLFYYLAGVKSAAWK